MSNFLFFLQTLSPVRSNQRASTQLQPLSHESQRQSKKPDCSFTTADGQPDFREIWPSTDSEFSPGSNTASPEIQAYKQSAKSETSMVSSGVKEDSVLAKYISLFYINKENLWFCFALQCTDLRSYRYIDRFRHGKPQSREERQQMASVIGQEQVSFWWTSHSTPSSASTKTADKGMFSLTEVFIGLCYLFYKVTDLTKSLVIFSCNPFLWMDILLVMKDLHDSATYSTADLCQHDKSLSVSFLFVCFLYEFAGNRTQYMMICCFSSLLS